MNEGFAQTSIAVPAAGGKSWYSAYLYRCRECGAAVHGDDRSIHRAWHDSLRESSES